MSRKVSGWSSPPYRTRRDGMHGGVGASRQCGNVEAGDVVQQFDEASGGVVEDGFAGGSGRGGRIAGDAGGREVGHLPAEGMRAIGAQVGEIALEAFLRGREVA